MTQSMLVVFIKDTGHVVGASTQLAEASEPDLELAVGNDFPLYNIREVGSTEGPLELPLPRAILDIKSVPYDPAALAKPQSYVVDGGVVNEIPPPPSPNPGILGPPTIDLFADHIKIELPGGAVPPEDIDVMTVVVGLDPADTVRRVQSGVIKADTPAGVDPGTVQLNHAILPGEPAAAITRGANYGVIVALGGRRPVYDTQIAQ